MTNRKYLLIALFLMLLPLLVVLIITAIPAPAHSFSLFSEPPAAVTCFKNCRLDSRGYDLIKNFEGYSPFVYKDSVGIPTIGFGHVVRAGERFTQPLIGPDAQTLLEKDVAGTERGVNALVATILQPNQFDALISFSFNLGTTTLKKSTLLKRVNAKLNDQVPPQFMRYVNAGGHKLPGLVARRRLEAQTYAMKLSEE